MDESKVLSPQEVERRRQSTQIQEKENEVFDDLKKETKAYPTAVEVNFESKGRFDTPKTLHFSDYKPRHLNDIAVSSSDSLLKTVCKILEELVVDDNVEFKAENQVIEELIESLIGIKMKFEGNAHTHRWMCNCQSDEEEADQTINETIINLSELTFTSIEEADDKLREKIKADLDALTDKEYKEYLLTKYKNKPLDDIESHTREVEAASNKITAPFYINDGKVMWGIKFLRLKDIMEANSYVSGIYEPKIKLIQNRKEHGIPLHKLKEKKAQEIKALQEEQGKVMLSYVEAMLLHSKDGVELTSQEKWKAYNEEVPRYIMDEVRKIFDNFRFGLNHEIELQCPMCGNAEKRWLQLSIDPRELLPVRNSGDNKTLPTVNELRGASRVAFYFGT